MASFVALRDVSKSYVTKRGERFNAIAGVSIDIAAREFVTIIGPSGCGKSTLLKLIAGLVMADDGDVLVGGRKVKGPQPNVGLVFQEPSLLPWRDVLGNVMLPADILGLERTTARRRAHELLETVGLRHHEGKYPSELSGGMQQRVAISRALLFEPSILLMDEPFGSLDALTRDEMCVELLNVWSTQTKTIVFVTHSIPEAVLLGGRVVVMTERPGKVLSVLQIDLGTSRDLSVTTTPRFGEYVTRIRALLSRPNKW